MNNSFNAGINTALTKAENDARDAYGRRLMTEYLDNPSFAAAIDGIVVNAKHEADADVAAGADRHWDGFPSIRAIKNIRESFDAKISLLYCKRLFEASDRRNGWTGTR